MNDRTGQALLTIRDLRTYFFLKAGVLKAVDGIDLDIDPGDLVGIVGESGCGKSVTALSILRLIKYPPGRVVTGRILFGGKDLLQITDEEMRAIRGNRISMVFQEPMTSLNPVSRVGNQIAEGMMVHQGISKKEAMERAVELLRLVDIPSPEERIQDYPHQMSGGMRQRVMIAMALACNPDLFIADEPTTALDVTIQAQILELIHELKVKKGLTILLITHNLGVVAENANKVVVMYAGKIMEKADVKSLFLNPLHPYTRGLLRSIPRVDRKSVRRGDLETIQGVVPNLLHLGPGCRFNDRCDESMEQCRKRAPGLFAVREGHWVRCWQYGEKEDG